MSVLTEACWAYPPGSAPVSVNPNAFSPIPLPVSPLSTSPTAVSSPPLATFSSPITGVKHLPGDRNRTRRNSSRMYSTSSSLPNPKELSIEDDWTRVKDPKEKKRIQNRVAQRTYRHRMKAKLGELQARLDSHERHRIHAVAHIGNEMTRGVAGVPIPFNPNGIPPNGHAGLNPSMTTVHGGDVCRSPLGIDQQTPQLPVLQASAYEVSANESDSSLFPHNPQFLSSPPNSHPSPQAQNGLPSPPGRSDSEQSTKVSPEFVLDCLRFQTQLLNRLNTLQEDPGCPGQGQYTPTDGLPQVINEVSQDHMACMGNFTPGHSEGVDFSFESTADGWKPGDFAHKLRQAPARAIHFSPLMDMAAQPIETAMSSSACHNNTQGLPSPEAPMDKRVDSIVQHVRAIGFESFDDAATAYYTSAFKDAPPLAHEPRAIRHRRLGKMISDVFQAAGEWAHWERQSLHEDITEIARSMVTSEASTLDEALLSQTGALMETHGFQDASSREECLQALKRSVQHELPNSWALNMALAHENRHGYRWSKDHSDTALATILLQQFAGRIPKDKLLQLVEACL